MSKETILLILENGKVERVFRLPTENLKESVRTEIGQVARGLGFGVEFHTIGTDGVESVKWELKEMKGKNEA